MHKNLFLAFSLTVGAIVMVFGSGAASAASYGDTSPIYVGAAVGRLQYKTFCGPEGRCTVHDNGSGKVYAGFNFAPTSLWAGSELTNSIEAVGYFGGKVPIRMFPSNDIMEESYRGGGVVYKASLRQTDALSVQARLGMARITSKYRFRNLDIADSHKNGVTGGFGLSYTVTRNVALTADYDVFKARFGQVEDKNVHLFTVGAAYKF